MNKLGIKLLKYFTVLIAITIATLTCSYYFTYVNIRTGLQEEGISSVKKAIKYIEGDKLLKVLQSRNMETDEYKAIQVALIGFKANEDIRYIYTIGKWDNKFVYIVDGTPIDTYPLGEEFAEEPELIEAFGGTPAVNKSVTEDNGFKYISAYAPVKDSSGNIIGVVGVDKDASILDKIKSKLINSLIIVSIVYILASLIICLLFSRGLSKKIEEIQNGLVKMSEGDLTNKIDIKSKDEIKIIAESINTFQVQIKDIIKAIKDEVEILKMDATSLKGISIDMDETTQTVVGDIQEIISGIDNQASDLQNINESLTDLWVGI